MLLRRWQSRAMAAAAMAVVAVGTTAAPAAARSAPVQVLLDGLSSPEGLAVSGDDAVIAQGAFGPPGPVLALALRGAERGQTVEVTGPLSLTDVVVAPSGVGYGLIGTSLY